MSDCNKTVITKKGEKGDNAFKFTKEFANVSATGTIITVTLAEMIACGVLPVGCLGTATTSNFPDLNVQVWVKDITLGKTYWEQGGVGSLAEDIAYIRVDATTGEISTRLDGGSGNVSARIVVTG